MKVYEFFNTLAESQLSESKEIFTKEELDPVVIQKTPPGQEKQPPPPGKGQESTNVEIHELGEKPKSDPSDPKTDPSEPETGDEAEIKEVEAKQKAEDEKEAAQKAAEKQKPRTSFDSHEILEKSNKSEAKDLAEKIFKEAEERRKKDGDPSEPGKEDGGFIEKLKGIYEPRIDWVKELKKRLTSFKSKTSSTVDRFMTKAAKYKEGVGREKSKAYHQWLKDPRSHSQTPGKEMIFKGPYVKGPVSEAVMIIALDTSGSITEDTISKVFSEMDKIAKQFERGMQAGSSPIEGKVYFMAWDTAVQQVDPYKAGQWKQYVSGTAGKGIKGRGGTTVTSVFKYINDHFVYDESKSKKHGLLNIVEKPTETGISKHDIVVPMKKGKPELAPFIVIATDGYFSKPTDADLGDVFIENKDNIIYLIIDGDSSNVYPDGEKNIIEYDTYKI